ncbi:MAG: sigma 54-interacting transcriptional regulator [Myxococcota bacterium]
MQKLHRYVTTHGQLVGAIDGAHSPATEEGVDPIATVEDGPDRGVLGLARHRSREYTLRPSSGQFCAARPPWGVARPPVTATSPAARPGGAPLRRRWIRVRGPDAPLGEVDLPKESLVLGREPGSKGFVLDDETASRRHAELSYLPDYDCHQIRDLGSKNGVYVDGRRVEKAVLDAGTVLRIGASLFVYEVLDVPEAEQLRPSDTVSLAKAHAERLVDRAGGSQLPVLLRGPTGAGKERLAQRYHEASGRRGPLVPVNCAAIPGELIATELFGHVRGAFSEAKSARLGLVASAEGGTLFLDEIAELPLEQQATLLRVLQERRLRPVGSDKEQPVDVRFVAATHVDLEAASKAGRFRSDLYARLAGIEVDLPGLAQRRVEVLPLFHGFAPDLELDDLAAERLLLYDWPRNVRELELLARRLVALLDGSQVNLETLPAAVRGPSAELGPSPAHEEKPPTPPSARPERAEVEALLAKYRGRVADVARALAVTRQSVYRMMEEHGLSAAEFRRRP